MMKVLLLVCAILSGVIGISQTRVNEGRRTISTQDFQEYDRTTARQKLAGGSAAPATQSIEAGSYFTIINETSLPDYYIIYFWDWKEDSAKRSLLNFEAGSTITKKYFVVPKNNLDIVSEKIVERFSPSIGALTFPFKYRPQSGKFETTFAIGIAGGVTWNIRRLEEHRLSALFGVTASSARVDKYSADSVANITDVTERTSATFSFSLMYQWQRLQVGLLVGMDNILDNEVIRWKYQGKPWFSIGIGIGLFTPNEPKAASGTHQ